MEVSIIVAVKNEEANLLIFYNQLKKVLIENKLIYQMIFVDDFSIDQSPTILKKIVAGDQLCQLIHLSSHQGQSAAIAAGLKQVQYEIVAFIDADLQCDVKDLLVLLAKLNEGFDYVGGIRTDRRDNLLTRLASKVANQFRNIALGENFKDSTSCLRVLKTKTLEDIEFKDAFHRFLPSLVIMQGYKACEVPIRHYLRQHDQSKYSIFNRLWPSWKALVEVKKLKKKFKK